MPKAIDLSGNWTEQPCAHTPSATAVTAITIMDSANNTRATWRHQFLFLPTVLTFCGCFSSEMRIHSTPRESEGKHWHTP